MLDGFEDIAYDLTEEERTKIVPLFVKGFYTHIGKEKAITNAKIREGFEKTKKITLADSKVRAIIGYIRDGLLFDDYVLCSSSKGNYLTDDPEEIKRWLISLEQRIMKIQNIHKKCSDKLQFIIKKKENVEKDKGVSAE